MTRDESLCASSEVAARIIGTTGTVGLRKLNGYCTAVLSLFGGAGHAQTPWGWGHRERKGRGLLYT
jgi:hypothetical protein